MTLSSGRMARRALAKLRAGQLRHQHVSDQEIYFAGVGIHQGKRFFSVRSGQHVIPKLLEEFSAQAA